MRKVVAVVLYVLLLCMQQEGYRHGLEHLRQQLAQAHEQLAQLPADVPCGECALLAGGAHAVPGGDPVDIRLAASQAVAEPPILPARASAPHHYSARAPPLLA